MSAGPEVDQNSGEPIDVDAARAYAPWQWDFDHVYQKMKFYGTIGDEVVELLYHKFDDVPDGFWTDVEVHEYRAWKAKHDQDKVSWWAERQV